MSNIDAYTAGILDGEGTVTLSHNAPNERRSPVVSVTTTTPELMDFLRENYGGSVRHQGAKTSAWSESWIWSVRGRKALVFLRQVLPYMVIEEKRRRATLLVDKYEAVTPRNGKYTPEMETNKTLFESEFFAGSNRVLL